MGIILLLLRHRAGEAPAGCAISIRCADVVPRRVMLVVAAA